MKAVELGIADLHPLPGVAADPARWQALRERVQKRVFLRSEGNTIELEAPQQVAGTLRAQVEQVVAQFNRFYADTVAAYFTHPALRDDFLVNPLLDPLIELEDPNEHATTPLSRFDAVLEPNGDVRVIEINSVGVCLIHMRGLLYLIRELARGGFADDAKRLDEITRTMVVRGFTRFVEAQLPAPRKRLVVGALTPSRFFPAGHLLYRAAFQRWGCDYVYGGPEHLEVTEQDIRIRGTPIDVLWADFFFYFAYQAARYKEIPSPTMPDWGKTPEQASELLSNKRFLAHLRNKRVINVSPARSYLALPKSLLSWIHRSDRPVNEENRAFLQNHVARTYSARDRTEGLIALADVANHRGEFLVKPCQYGGSFGVQLGCLTEADAWRAKLIQIWDHPQWAVQEFREPAKTADGRWTSLGLPNFDGELGGIFIRTAGSVLLNWRDAGFVPCAFG